MCRALLLLLVGRAPAAEPAPAAVELRAPPAVATTLDACGGAGPETLEVIGVLPTPESDASLRRAICDWFHDDRWRVRFSSGATSAERPSSVLRVALELSSSQAVLSTAEGPLGRWMRQVPLVAGLDDAGVEAVAEAIHSAAQAAVAPPITPRAGGSRSARARAPTSPGAGAEPPPGPEPAGPEPREPAPPELALLEPAPIAPGRELVAVSRPRVEADPLPVHTAIAYQAYARGPEPFMHGPALHIELDALSFGMTSRGGKARGSTLGASFRASVFTSAVHRTTGFDVRTSGASLALAAAASVPMGGLTARAGLGGGLDLVALAVRVNDLDLARRVPGRGTSPRPFASAEAGVSYRWGSFELALGALLRMLLFDTQYQVLTPGGPVTLLQPWRLQPGGVLELGYVW